MTEQAGPARVQWDAVYKLLNDHGFSRKPVMEGAGASAGEAYAWSIENPDKVACIYGENPALAKSDVWKEPLLDHLGPLAKAGMPLIHVCGSLDPRFTMNTLALEKRYKEWAARSRSLSSRARNTSAHTEAPEGRRGLDHENRHLTRHYHCDEPNIRTNHRPNSA